jgi:hypothetical protein
LFPDAPELPGVPGEPAFPGVPGLPAKPEIVDLLSIWIYVPAAQPVPVLRAAVEVLVDPTGEVMIVSTFSGYVGFPACAYRLTSFVEELILTTLVGLASNPKNIYLTSGKNDPYSLEPSEKNENTSTAPTEVERVGAV